MISIDHIYRYPVKGLSAEAMERVSLSVGNGLPGDRQYAFAKKNAPFDPANPAPLSKTNFLMLMQYEKLAALQTKFDPGSEILTITKPGGTKSGGDKIEGCLGEPDGRTRLEEFFFQFMDGKIDDSPRLVQSSGHMFSDRPEKVVSLNNLASISDLSDRLGRPVDPLRFRANIYFSGVESWREFDWVDRRIRIGRAELLVIDRIVRCAATNVDPKTAERDMNIPKSLQGNYGHPDMGIYARVMIAGDINLGDRIELI